VARTVAGIRVSEESMPYGFGYGGALAPGGRPTEAEVGVVLADLARRRVIRASLVPNPLVAATWAGAAPRGAILDPYLCHVIDLDGGFDEVWAKKYRQDARRNVRRAMKQPLEVREGLDSGVVEVFAELNSRSVHRWAVQRGQPLWLAHLVERRRNRVEQLASAVAALGGMCVVRTAHLDGEPVAAYVFLLFGEHAYSWMSAMDRDLARKTNAGALLQSLAIEDACRGGARWFQFGESDPGSGVEMFKTGFGAEPLEYAALRIERLPVTATDRRLRAAVGRLSALRRASTGAAGS